MKEVVALRCKDVWVPPNRLRALKPDEARAIGESIKAHGQFEPIKVARDPKTNTAVLVDGWHRLEGCRLARIQNVQAIFIGDDKAGRLKHEVISGIARATHDVFDRAAAIDALARLARFEAGLPEEGDLRSRNGWRAPPKQCEEAGELIFQHIGKLMRWDIALAERLGCGIQTIRALTTIHHRIDENHREFLRARGEAANLSRVLQFARMTKGDMGRVYTMMSEDKALDLAEAMARLTAPAIQLSQAEKAQNAFFRKAERWTPRERASFFHQWQAAYHPDGRARAKG